MAGPDDVEGSSQHIKVEDTERERWLLLRAGRRRWEGGPAEVVDTVMGGEQGGKAGAAK